MNIASVNASSALGPISGAIASAASATGVDFGYLLAQARLESGGVSSAASRTSSAGGLYQFIDSTWLAVLKRHGAAHGLGWAADAIEWVGGKLGIRDSATRAAVLGLKRDPQVAALMAGAHAADNKAGLEARLGRSVGATELYLAHFLGLGGATHFLRAMELDPRASAAAMSPHAAHGNRHVFFGHSGAARSLQQVYDRLAARLGGAAAVAPAPVQTMAAAAPASAPSATYARAAFTLLADLGQ